MTGTLYDPGGKHRWPLLPGVRGYAVFSDDDRARYELWRRWWHEERPYWLWCGMNPSTARATVDDPTVRKEQGISARHGARAMAKVNLAAIRATSPKDVTPEDVARYHEMNMSTIERLMMDAERVVVAWGKVPKPMVHLPGLFVEAAERLRVPLWCVGTIGDGSPRHPLYVTNDVELQPWPRRTTAHDQTLAR